jgi:hypothetical protein
MRVLLVGIVCCYLGDQTTRITTEVEATEPLELGICKAPGPGSTTPRTWSTTLPSPPPVVPHEEVVSGQPCGLFHLGGQLTPFPHEFARRIRQLSVRRYLQRAAGNPRLIECAVLRRPSIQLVLEGSRMILGEIAWRQRVIGNGRPVPAGTHGRKVAQERREQVEGNNRQVGRFRQWGRNARYDCLPHSERYFSSRESSRGHLHRTLNWSFNQYACVSPHT